MARFIAFTQSGLDGLAIETASGTLRGLPLSHPGAPGDLLAILRRGEGSLAHATLRLADAPEIDPNAVSFLPPIPHPGKIICIGLNYVDHSTEAGFEAPSFPTVFARFANSLTGSGQPLVRPCFSDQFDFEGEIAAVIGKKCHRVSADEALDYVAGYSLFNDGSIRDYQFKSPQWTVGKTIDRTGSFGPALVTADELPAGARGLRLETRLNGTVVQSASTNDMIFDVATLIAILSEGITLDPGDVIVTGTPAGVGMARTPPLWMKQGDVCEIEVKGIGLLSNPIVDDVQSSSTARPVKLHLA